jgi:hypothetical protein
MRRMFRLQEQAGCAMIQKERENAYSSPRWLHGEPPGSDGNATVCDPSERLIRNSSDHLTALSSDRPMTPHSYDPTGLRGINIHAFFH